MRQAKISPQCVAMYVTSITIYSGIAIPKQICMSFNLTSQGKFI